MDLYAKYSGPLTSKYLSTEGVLVGFDVGLFDAPNRVGKFVVGTLLGTDVGTEVGIEDGADR